MTIFKFTIRATDNQGAFSDREFSVDVYKTNIERFLIGYQDEVIRTSTNGTSFPSTSEHIGAAKAPNYSTLGLRTNGIAYGNGVWIQNIGDALRCLRSTNGVIWDRVPYRAANSSFPIGTVNVTFNQGYFYMCNSSTASAIVISKSANGLTWTDQTITSGLFRNHNFDLAHSNGVMKMFHRRHTGALILWNSSTNSLQQVNLPIDVKKIKFVNGVWFALSLNTYQMLASTDGLNWTEVSLPALSNNSLMCCSDIAYGNGLLVVTITRNNTNNSSTSAILADLNTVLYSRDGITFTKASTNFYANSTWPTSANTNDMLIQYTNGVFVIAHYGSQTGNAMWGKIVHSTNATSWTSVSVHTVSAKFLVGVDSANY